MWNAGYGSMQHEGVRITRRGHPRMPRCQNENSVHVLISLLFKLENQMERVELGFVTTTLFFLRRQMFGLKWEEEAEERLMLIRRTIFIGWLSIQEPIFDKCYTRMLTKFRIVKLIKTFPQTNKKTQSSCNFFFFSKRTSIALRR